MASEKTIDRAAIRAASEIKPVPNAKSHPDVIVLDTETTGFVAGRDHLLTVGVCDGDGREVLYLELCPPLECDAQATAWCWRHVQRDMLSRGGCDLEAEARDASDASRCRSGAIKADRDRVVR